ncbi:hypothetical protein ASPZODRAFT_136142 [Penicilliopsis zonata CBS 506.65]|uniref:Rhodopsin domain-containing protein n=1 Tax=Penicilliopsis zonata CBS 506.65 TaxID=1073090 RepID=A0A1L9S976_9EURO|nr:hypothetical protein ASPZODRAFT_136142 [Penicilliopsis zonata CBS 506.65]OJJ43679.1 hypothetical protein ASPZODRAFT_136142 [Penicilliopsis zonata CBS 506.65]
MDIPEPSDGDIDIGTNVFHACWALTGIVGVVLLFRYSVKAWIRWALPQVTAPERVWGLEDLFFLIGYGFDLAHMSIVQISSKWGLGRHYYYLTSVEKVHAMKYDFISQPIAVTAAMVSRAGMMWFLFTCFSASNRRLRIVIVICMIVQIVVNLVTVVQILVQCGPNPYRPSDRLKYFHYMWDSLPADGSVKCQDPSTQMIIGFVQGGFNSVIDFFLAIISAVELWQFFLQTLHRNPELSFWSQFQKISSSVRSRRIWQTITLSGPLLLSGAASIVKTYLLKTLGSRQDFTYNIVPFVLWVKIENYSILLATCAPVIRLFFRTFIERRREGHWGGYWRSNSDNKNHHNSDRSREAEHQVELDNRVQKNLLSTTTTTTLVTQNGYNDEEVNPAVVTDYWSKYPDGCTGRFSKATRGSPVKASLETGRVTVQTDIMVQVDEGVKRSMSSSGERLLETDP